MFIDFLGYALIAFGPFVTTFVYVDFKSSLKTIVLISAAFFWLLSLFISSILWKILSNFNAPIAVSIFFAVIFQEIFRVLFWIVLRKAEIGLESMSEIDCGSVEEIRNNRLKLTVSAGLGFGIMSGAFSFIDILSYSIGYGTVGIQGGSQFYFLAAAFLTQIFIFHNLCWTVILNFAMETKYYWHVLIVVLSHLFCSFLTLLNETKSYLNTVILNYVVLFLLCLISFHSAGYHFKVRSSMGSVQS